MKFFVLLLILIAINLTFSNELPFQSKLLSTAEETSCITNYTSESPNKIECVAFYQGKNSWWLPNGYMLNAICNCEALSLDDINTSCIRDFLMDRLNNTEIYSPQFKEELAMEKKYWEFNSPAKFFSYQAYIIYYLAPKLYNDHNDAYKGNLSNIFLLK